MQFILTALLSLLLVATPELLIPLRMSIYQTVGIAPLTLRVKTTAAERGKEVCVVVDGPEYRNSCKVMDGITWTQDFILRAGGCYQVFAHSENYRTTEIRVRVIGHEGTDCGEEP